MDRAEWLALAERCEKATGPNFALEQDIALAGSFGDSVLKPPAVTALLDAIVFTIERELPGWGHGYVTKPGFAPKGFLQEFDKDEALPPVCLTAATPALALCAAFCKAMSETADAS